MAKSHPTAGNFDTAAAARRAAAGDRAAFGDLYDRYHDELLAYARRSLPVPEDAEDLVEQAFYKALRAISRRNQDRPFNIWLFHLTRNLITDFYRTRHQQPSLEERGKTEQSPEDEVVGRTLDPQVEAALSVLTSRQRWVIRMRVLDGLSYAEIAQRLDCREGAVRAMQMRALRALRAALSPDETGSASA